MKKALALALIVICAASCKKGSAPLPDTSAARIFGQWEVSRVYGGNIYPPDSTYRPGNGNILQFNSDSTFGYYAQGKLINSGLYHTRKFSSSIFTNFTCAIYFSADTSFKTLLSLQGDKLTLKPILPDIATTDYQRIPNVQHQ